MKVEQQSSGISDYYFSQPIIFPKNFILGISHYNKTSCPFYAPVCKDGMCRLCYCDSKNHRKYFLYSNYARKIQKCYFKYYFRKRNKQNQILFKKYIIDYSIFYNILEYKILNYRYKKMYF